MERAGQTQVSPGPSAPGSSPGPTRHRSAQDPQPLAARPAPPDTGQPGPPAPGSSPSPAPPPAPARGSSRWGQGSRQVCEPPLAQPSPRAALPGPDSPIPIAWSEKAEPTGDWSRAHGLRKVQPRGPAYDCLLHLRSHPRGWLGRCVAAPPRSDPTVTEGPSPHAHSLHVRDAAAQR